MKEKQGQARKMESRVSVQEHGLWCTLARTEHAYHLSFPAANVKGGMWSVTKHSAGEVEYTPLLSTVEASSSRTS